MTDDSVTLRLRYFAKDWLAWAALRHFLPARLVRELAGVIVAHISNGTLVISDLFDETVTPGPEWNSSWLLQPRPVNTPLEQYLQYHVRAIAWQNDARRVSIP